MLHQVHRGAAKNLDRGRSQIAVVHRVGKRIALAGTRERDLSLHLDLEVAPFHPLLVVDAVRRTKGESTHKDEITGHAPRSGGERGAAI